MRRIPAALALPFALPFALATGADARPRGLAWTLVNTAAVPTLRCAGPDCMPETFRISCAPAGLRLEVVTRSVPRGVARDAQTFPSRVSLFLGQTELSLGGIATRCPEGGSRVEVPVPRDIDLLAEVARQGRLVAVTFAGRTDAPPPPPELAAAFRAACATER